MMMVVWALPVCSSSMLCCTILSLAASRAEVAYRHRRGRVGIENEAEGVKRERRKVERKRERKEGREEERKIGR